MFLFGLVSFTCDIPFFTSSYCFLFFVYSFAQRGAVLRRGWPRSINRMEALLPQPSV